ncbi:MAG: hypothetical protein PHH64_00840, partial [Proteiniphilum sp.]|nr:hypothetical protein [Proteiniphilum sp.]
MTEMKESPPYNYIILIIFYLFENIRNFAKNSVYSQAKQHGKESLLQKRQKPEKHSNKKGHYFPFYQHGQR